VNSKAKKLIITNLPYPFTALLATKLGLAWRLTDGADFSATATFAHHITQYESRRAHRTVYNEYAKRKDPNKREAYYAKHGAEIEAFKDARDCLNTVMNGRTDPVANQGVESQANEADSRQTRRL